MKYIVLDFDRTLFNTEFFYNSIELQHVLGMKCFPDGFKMNEYLYNDSVYFLDQARRLGWNLILLTYGSRSVQEYKFKSSGIMNYFKASFYVETGKKVDAVKSLVSNSMNENNKIVFIDDTLQHLYDFKEVLPRSKVFRMARPGAKGSDVVDTRFTSIASFTDILDFLREI